MISADLAATVMWMCCISAAIGLVLGAILASRMWVSTTNNYKRECHILGLEYQRMRNEREMWREAWKKTLPPRTTDPRVQEIMEKALNNDHLRP